ncbi:MAG: 4a-hydroxytetrahydrobiopterin dehydratase [Mariniblastus sp.]|jgi:4a-hydroxytetrahydrobiopterin dehydratase
MEIQDPGQLTAKKCVPCEGGVDACPLPFVTQQLEKLPGWYLTHENQRIRKDWTAKNFVKALDFFNRVGAVSEAEAHHPDLHLVSYNQVSIEIWTHAIGGLSENDFILAAKIDELDV